LFLPPPYKLNDYGINTKVLSVGEDLGEGSARRVNINESTTLSPSPSPSGRVASAFTLAEVLITLVIIGVIAAITVPTLITKYQKEQTVTRLKKVYSTLTQAVLKSKFENGPIEEWYNQETNNNASDYFNKYWKPYFNVEKICTNYSNCNYSAVQPWFFVNGDVYTWSIAQSGDRFFFYLVDGTFVTIQAGAGSSVFSRPNLVIDLNGPKKPNKLGKDVFFLTTDNDKGVVPYGYNSSYDYILNNCKKVNSTGYFCLAKIMKDGWQIKDDYPW